MAMWCRLKATRMSYLHEPYYRERKEIPLCKDHWDWLERSDEDENVDYPEWQEKQAIKCGCKRTKIKMCGKDPITECIQCGNRKHINNE
jgi:hypothetical protein